MRLRHALALLAFAAASVAAVPHASAAADSPRLTISLDLVDVAPRPFRLSAPRPNPFSAQTRLEVSVEEASELTVSVHDALGRRVALLHDGALRPGTYTVRFDAESLPPGLYIVRAHDSRGNTATRSVALVR